MILLKLLRRLGCCHCCYGIAFGPKQLDAVKFVVALFFLIISLLGATAPYCFGRNGHRCSVADWRGIPTPILSTLCELSAKSWVEDCCQMTFSPHWDVFDVFGMLSLKRQIWLGQIPVLLFNYRKSELSGHLSQISYRFLFFISAS